MSESARDLSFMVEGMWTPERTGDYCADNDRGRDYAEEMIAMMGRTGCPIIFSSVARAMTLGGVYDAVEIGFCTRIGVTIMVNQ